MSLIITDRFYPPVNESKLIRIAYGSAADIWVIRDREELPQRAYKVVRINSEVLTGPRSSEGEPKFWKDFVKEYREKVTIWSELNHPNVARVFGISNGLNLEVEYYENGSVREYIELRPGLVDEVTMTLQILHGVKYLHEHIPPIVHGNLNAGKLYVDRHGKTLVGEFGLAAMCRTFAADIPSIHHTGSSRWLSPELVGLEATGFYRTLKSGKVLSIYKRNNSSSNPREPTIESDVWALGCTLYEILAKVLPYSKQKNEVQVIRAVIAGNPPGYQSDCPSSSTTELIWPTIEHSWIPDPIDRPAISRLAADLNKSLAESTIKFQYGVHTTQRPPTFIGRNTPLKEIFHALTSYGCRDLTGRLELPKGRSEMVHGSAYRDLYTAVLSPHTLVAVKIARRSEGDGRGLAREIYILSRCKHPNILPLLGLAVFQGTLGAVSPWMKNGSVTGYLGLNPGVDRYDMSAQISAGVAYLHSIPVVHGNIKGSNIVVSDEGNPMICGFGGAMIEYGELQFKGIEDRPGFNMRWTAPERIAEEPLPNQHTDVYSLGMTILEIISGMIPYADMGEPRLALAKMLRQNPKRPDDTIPPTPRGDAIRSLLLRCWDYKPQDRPSAHEVAERMREIAQGVFDSEDSSKPRM